MNDSTSPIAQGYDRWSAVYDHDANPLLVLEEPVVRSIVGDPSGLKILDLGCGTGRHALWLVEHGARVTAVDFSSGMLAQAREKPGAGAIRFVQHDLLQSLPFEAGWFDLIVSGLVVEHLPDLRSFFGEMKRLLAPGGRAIVSAMHPAMFLRGSQARFADPVSGEIVKPGSHDHSLSQMIMSALDAKLRIVRIEELAADAQLARACPRAEKYIGWPMLVVFEFFRDWFS